MASLNPMAPLVSAAKITKPVAHGALFRHRLFDLLDRSHTKVTWIAGPPGSGKTMLAATYAEHAKKPCLWLRLDATDVDPASFFLHLTKAVSTAGVATTTPLPVLAPEQLHNVPVFAHQFFRALFQPSQAGRLLILDDVHEIPEDSVVASLFPILLQEVTSGTQVIALSRKELSRHLTRGLANKELQEIGAEDLAMTLEEAEALLRQPQGSPDSATTARLHDLTKGWAAGLVLYKGVMKGGRLQLDEPARLLPRRLQQYFDSEVIKTLPSSELDLLVKTAWLPSLTQPLMAAVTGTSAAGAIVAEMARKGLFVTEHETTEPAFSYHPLFRQMLRTLAEQRLATDQAAAIQRDSAQALEQAGEFDEAVELWLAVGDHAHAAGVIVAQAPRLLAQAQFGTLTRWLEALPAPVRRDSPWLLLWEGSCRMLFGPAQGLQLFEKAVVLFQRQGDPIGTLLACCGGVEAIIADWQALNRLDPWIERLGGFFSNPPPLPPDLELRGASAMLSALLWRQPQDPRIEDWAKRVLALSSSVPNPVASVVAITQLIHFHLWRGEVAEAGRVYAMSRNEAWESALSPLPYLVLKILQSCYLWKAGFVDECYRTIAQGLEWAKTTGVRILDHHLISQGIFAAFVVGDTRASARYLADYGKCIPPGHPVIQAHYQYLFAWDAWLRGDLTTAWANGQEAFKIFKTAGAPFVSGLLHLSMAHLLFERGSLRQAKQMLAQTMRIARSMKSQDLSVPGLLLEADMALSGDDSRPSRSRPSATKLLSQAHKGRGLQALADAMRLAAQHGMVGLSWSHPRALSRLCAIALEAGIEVAYVQELIRKKRLVVPENYEHLDSWPWPIQIYTLGRFVLMIDGQPVAFPGRTQKRPLDLLKMLVALGGREVPEQSLLEGLWPDAEGDTAAHAFEMLVKRLRTLVGHSDALVVKAGTLTLNPRLCWVDAWAFERAMGQAARDRTSLEQAIALYAGSFLSGDEEPWAVSTRERLRRKFLLSVTRLGKAHEEQQEWEQALQWYGRGLDVDDLAEEFYRGLMQCHAQLGRRAEAAATYQRCRRALVAGLGLTPSSQTEQLYRQLLAPTT